MIVELAPEDKIIIVEQHMKNLLFTEYNLKMSLLEAQSNDEVVQSSIDAINKQIQNVSVQKDALTKEVDSLQAQIDAAAKKASPAN